MKLASLKAGGRDGTLVVVSKDLQRCRRVPGIAATMQAALDDWDALAPGLASVYAELNMASAEGEAFESHKCHSPLPRAFQWADGDRDANLDS